MAKIFGVNTKISGKVGQLLYRQTRTGTGVLSTFCALPHPTNRMAQIEANNVFFIMKMF